MQVVLYSDDIHLLSHWENALKKSYSSVDSLEELYELKSSIIIINYSAFLGESHKILSRLIENENRVLVLHRTPFFKTAKELLKIGAYGYGNALMKEHFIVSAVNAISESMVWLYPEFTSQLINELPANREPKQELALQNLTQREKDTALLLKDGLTYKDIAHKLDITPRTVKAHAKNIYTKLNIKDRLALALLLK